MRCSALVALGAVAAVLVAGPQAQVQAVTPTSCVASSLLHSGCMVSAGAGVELHFELVGSPPTLATFVLKAQTGGGYIGFASCPAGSSLMVPADAVIGAPTTGVKAYRIDGYDESEVTPDSSVFLTNASVAASNGYTVLRFTRRLSAGRFPIDPSALTFNVAVGMQPGLGDHSDEASGVLDLESGVLVASTTDSRDKFWVTHGALMVAAWALFASHGIAVARCKAKWSVLLKSDAAWFHLHRILQLLAFAAHIAAMAVALTSFGNYVSDGAVQAHMAIAWVVTALLGFQLVVAFLLRPDKQSRRRPIWNLTHFTSGRLLLLAALANIGLGIFLYQRKTVALLIPLGGWVAMSAGALGTAVVHFAVMAAHGRFPAGSDSARFTEHSSAQFKEHSNNIEIVMQGRGSGA